MIIIPYNPHTRYLYKQIRHTEKSFEYHHLAYRQYSSKITNYSSDIFMTNLFEKSTQLKSEIEKYIKKNAKKTLDITKIDYSKQFYIIENQAFYLEYTAWEEVYKIMMTHNTYDIVTKGISKQNSIQAPGLVEKVHVIIKEFLTDVDATLGLGIKRLKASEDEKPFKHYETKELKEFKVLLSQVIKGRELTISELVVKSFEYYILNHTIKTDSLKNQRLQIPMVQFYRDIGTMLIGYYYELLNHGRDILPFITHKETVKNLTYQQFQQLILWILGDKISYKSDQARLLYIYMYMRTVLNDIQKDETIDKEELLNLSKVKLQLTEDVDKYSIKMGSMLGEVLCDDKHQFLKKAQKRLLNGKVQNVIELTEQIEMNLKLSASYYRPPLTKGCISNMKDRDVIRKLETKDYLVNIDVETRQTHYNKNYNTYAKRKGKAILNPKIHRYCVDKQFFKAYISYLGEVLADKNNDTERFELIQTFYHIDLKVLKENDISDKYTSIVEELIRFALDFSIFWQDPKNPSTLSYRIENYHNIDDDSTIVYNNDNLSLDFQVRKQLKKYYDRIVGIKIYLYGLLNEVNLYKDFNYFYIPQYISYTGRIFSACYYLQLQGNKLAQGFIVYRVTNSKNINEENYNAIQRAVKEVITSNTEQRKIEGISYNNYVQRTQELTATYMKSFFNDNPEIHDYLTLNSDNAKFSMSKTVSLFIRNIKKNKHTLIALNFYFNLINVNHHIATIIQKDATTSVYQMISILFKDKQLAKLTNLIGTDYIKIYNKYLEDLELSFQVIQQKSALYRLLEISNNKVIHDFIKHCDNIINIELPKEESRHMFLDNIKEIKLMLKKKMVALYKFILTHKLTIYPLIIKNTSKVSWILPGAYNLYKKVLTEGKSKNMTTVIKYVHELVYTLVIIKGWKLWSNSIEKNPFIIHLDLLEDKDIVKQLLMTYAYGAGEKTRITKIAEAIISKAHQNGVIKIQENALLYTATIISNYFEPWKNMYLRSARTLKRLSSKLNKAIEPIYMETPYVRWVLAPYILTKIEVPTKTLFGFRTHKLTLRVYDVKEDKIDGNELAKRFGAVYVHAADAYIVHRYIDKSIELRRKLKKLGVNLSWYNNHDCFGYNIALSVFLEYIVRDSYLDLYNIDYLATLDKNIDNKTVKEFIATIAEKPLNAQGNVNNNYLRAQDITNNNFIR
jgi:hypothetical protein